MLIFMITWAYIWIHAAYLSTLRCAVILSWKNQTLSLTIYPTTDTTKMVWVMYILSKSEGWRKTRWNSELQWLWIKVVAQMNPLRFHTCISVTHYCGWFFKMWCISEELWNDGKNDGMCFYRKINQSVDDFPITECPEMFYFF